MSYTSPPTETVEKPGEVVWRANTGLSQLCMVRAIASTAQVSLCSCPYT
jgi:hypothetical protein